MEEVNPIKYTDNPDFNDWLDNDEENNVVSIAGYSFPPSEVLYKLNYAQYEEALKDYLNDDALLIQEIYKDYPTPIAFYLYQAEENYDSAHHRLDLLKSCWESVVFTIYGIVVGEARHRKLPLREIKVKYKDFYTDRLAIKLTIVENILDMCKSSGHELKCGEIISIATITQLRELNKRRNEFEHSFAATADSQEVLYKELFPEMIDALRSIRDIQKVNLFRFHSAGSSILYPRCDVFNGHSLDGSKKLLAVKKEDFNVMIDYFNNTTIFAHIEENDMFCVSPFIHFKKELHDTHPLLMFFKKDLSAGKYLYEVVSKPGTVELNEQIFKDRDDELKALIV